MGIYFKTLNLQPLCAGNAGGWRCDAGAGGGGLVVARRVGQVGARRDGTAAAAAVPVVPGGRRAASAPVGGILPRPRACARRLAAHP